MAQTRASSPCRALNPTPLTGLISSRSSLRRYMIIAWTMFPRRAACTFVFLMSTKSCGERAEPARGVTETHGRTSLSCATRGSLPEDLRGPGPSPQPILHTQSGCTAGDEMHNPSRHPSARLESFELLSHNLVYLFVFCLFCIEKGVPTTEKQFKTSVRDKLYVSCWEDSFVEGTSAHDSERVLDSGRRGPCCVDLWLCRGMC